MTHPLSPEPAPVRAELNDDEIVALIRKHFPWQYSRAAEALTYEKSPPMFPQATYDVPKAETTAFVRDIERHALSDDAKDKQIAALKLSLKMKDAMFSVEAEQHVIWMERYIEAEAELARLKAETEDGERWRALMSSGKLHFMGCAGFEFTNSVEGSRALATSTATPRPGEDMHFGMEFWAEAKAGPDYPDNFERSLMVVYVDEIRRRNTTRST